MTAESGLKLLLRFISLTTVLALFSAVMPQSWLANLIHRVEPDTRTSTLVTYLVRMLSAMYAFTGLLCWIFSTDLKRYRPLIWILGAGSLFVASIGIVVLFVTVAPDHRTGIFWILFGDLAEGLAQAMLLVILLLCTRGTLLPGLPKASTPAHPSSGNAARSSIPTGGTMRMLNLCVLLGLASASAADPPPFRLGFYGPAKVIQLGDLGVRIFTFALLESPGVEEGPGAQGWAVDISSEGCEIVWASTNETEAAPTNIGGLRDRGFERTELVEIDGRVHAYSAVTLSPTGSVTLDPPSGPHKILQLALEMPRRAGEPCEHCVLFYANAREPRAPVIVWMGLGIEPSSEGAAYDLCRVPFRRGDANADGRVDISDAIRTLMFLFLGQSHLLCHDAADSDDSGELDLTDAVYTLHDLFRPGSAIPPPGPFECGIDPTSERLDCESYPPCGG